MEKDIGKESSTAVDVAICCSGEKRFPQKKFNHCKNGVKTVPKQK